jgi:hypothetical protein
MIYSFSWRWQGFGPKKGRKERNQKIEWRQLLAITASVLFWAENELISFVRLTLIPADNNSKKLFVGFQRGVGTPSGKGWLLHVACRM